MAAFVSSKPVARRTVRLADLDAYRAEVDRVMAAEQSGKLQAVGNWTAGQVLAHLAAWIEYAYVGFPISPPPWPIRFILKTFIKKKYLRDGMSAGVKIPGVPDGTVGQDQMATLEAAERLKRAIVRMRSEPPRYPSPAFGNLSQDEFVRINLRHAELHLGFLTY